MFHNNYYFGLFSVSVFILGFHLQVMQSPSTIKILIVDNRFITIKSVFFYQGPATIYKDNLQKLILVIME